MYKTIAEILRETSARAASRKSNESESKQIVLLKRMISFLYKSHKPSCQWEDAVGMLQVLLPRNNGENNSLWCSPIEYKCFDSFNKIVVLEVMDNMFRDHIEYNYNYCLLTAIKYAFGDDARYTIMCRCLVL